MHLAAKTGIALNKRGEFFDGVVCFALDNEVKSLHKHNVRLTIIGDISRFSRRLQDRIKLCCTDCKIIPDSI